MEFRFTFSRLFIAALAIALISTVFLSFADSKAPAREQASKLPATVYIFEASGDGLTIGDVLAAKVGDQLRRLETPSILGYGKNIWIKIKSDQPLRDELQYWLDLQSPLLDEAHLYQKTSSGHIIKYPTIGTEHPYANRDVSYRSPVYIIRGEANETLELYLNLRGNNSMVVAPVLMLPKDFFAEAALNDFSLVSLLLLTFVCSVVCAWLGISLRKNAYILLAAWIFVNFVRLASMTGISYQYLLHDIPHSTDLTIYGSWAAGAVIMDAFALHYIGAWKAWGKWARIYLSLALISAPIFVILITMGFQIAIVLGALLYILNDVLLLGIVVWQSARGFHNARTLLFSFCSITLGAVIQLGYFWGYMTEYSAAKYGFFIGILPMIAVLIHVGISRQMELFRAESDAKTQEIELHKRIEQELEYEVSKRTAELKDAMKRLASSLNLEEQARHDQHRFVMMLSHELRTPLALIDSAAINIELDLPPDSEALRLRCGRIRKNVSQMIRLIESSMHRKSYLNGGPEAVNGDADVYSMLYEAHDAARSISTQHEFKIEMEDFPDTIDCDSTMTTLVLRTLACNAVSYTPAGTIVTFSGRIERNGAIIEVKDNGPGMHPEDFPHVFERYFRGRNATNSAGTGLGLSLAREMIESQGGLLNAFNNPGKGFCVRIWLPI